MTQTQININFNRAISKANELDSIASDLKSLANNSFGESLDTLSQNWQSDNSAAYIKKGNTLKSQMVASAKQLNTIAASIRTCAARTKRAEEQALQLAKLREYGN